MANRDIIQTIALSVRSGNADNTSKRLSIYPVFLMALASCFFLLVLYGCGYHFHADGNPVGVEMGSLAIPLMESTSSDLGFENDFTRIIRDEFIRYTKVPLVSNDKADMILIGKITEIKTDPLTYHTTKTNVQGENTFYSVTDSRRLRIRLDAKMQERDTGRIIWAETGMEEKARYEVSEDPLTNRYNQKQALKEIAGRLVDRIYLKTMERF
jgi:hypothetical protein